MTSIVRSVLRFCSSGHLLFVGLHAFIGASALAQGPPEPPPLEWCVGGRWEGPFDWSFQVRGEGFTTTSKGCWEFSSAALIPTGAHAGKVLLFGMKPITSCNPGGEGPDKTYMFDPDAPEPHLIEIPQPLSSDISCAGLSWNRCGSLLVAGGGFYGVVAEADAYLFHPNTMGPVVPANPPGVPYPYIFVDTNVIPPLGPWEKIDDMHTERFYPTVLHLTRRPIYWGEGVNSLCGTAGELIARGAGIVLGGPAWKATDFVLEQGNYAWELIAPMDTHWKCGILPVLNPVLQNPEPNAPIWQNVGGPVPDVHPGDFAVRDEYDVPDWNNPPQVPPDLRFDCYPRAFELENGRIFVAGDVSANEVPVTASGQPVLVPNRPGSSWFAVPRSDQDPSQLKPLLESGPWPGGQGADDTNDRYFGSAVLLQDSRAGELRDRVIVFGGSMDQNYYGATPDGWSPDWVALSTVQEFDTLANSWILKEAELASPRIYCNAVVLPTGKILITGGHTAEIRDHADHFQPSSQSCDRITKMVSRPEIYDPGPSPAPPSSTSGLLNESVAVPVWNECQEPGPPANPCAGGPPGLAAINADKPSPRTHHHVAVLLQDARVFVAGGEVSNICGVPNPQHTGEIFSPPYLFQGFRPVISYSESKVDLTSGPPGVTFKVTVFIKDDPAHMVPDDGIVLVRPAAVTHHFDADQRYIVLERVEVSSSIRGYSKIITFDVTAPLESLAPEGYYMLFVVEQGIGACGGTVRVPSMGQFIQFIPPGGCN